MSDLVKRLRERPWRGGGESNDDAAIRRQKEREAGADLIEPQTARIAELEAALLSAKQHFVADEPLKAFVEICAALEGGKEDE